jgi:putative endonuclease
MYIVYILYSHSIEEYYCGQTNDLADRLKRHNNGESRSIKHGIPWKLVGYLIVETRSEAILLERKIKGRGIGRWLNSNSHLLQPG